MGMALGVGFSPLLLLRKRKRERNFPAFSSGDEEGLKLTLSTTKANYSAKIHRIENNSLVRLLCSAEITPQLTLHLTTGGEF